MKQRVLLVTLIGCLALCLTSMGLFGQAAQAEVSLDDHPTGPPLNGPWVAPYMSAEDEYGLWLPASLAGFVGPSPTLGVYGFYDSDVLVPGPALFMRFAPPPRQGSPYYVDAYSCDHSPMQPCGGGLFVRFSVDRATGGATPTDASYQQAQNNEQPADIYRKARPFTHPGTYVPLPPPAVAPWFFGGPMNPGNGFPAGPAGSGGFNQMMYDHRAYFSFLPAATPTFPPITPGSHDNVDALNEWPVSLANSNIYFALHPAEAIPRGFSPSDIFLSPGGALNWPAVVFAPAASLGLDNYGPGSDSVDGLALWDNGKPGVLEPGVDYAAFSLAPGSATLTNLAGTGIQISAGAVFFTDFQGFFYLWLYDSDMGVGNLPNPPLPVIKPWEVNIDALDLTIDPEPVPYINPITMPDIGPGTKK